MNFKFLLSYIGRDVITVELVTKCSLFTEKFYYNFVVFFEDINFMSRVFFNNTMLYSF